MLHLHPFDIEVVVLCNETTNCVLRVESDLALWEFAVYLALGLFRGHGIMLGIFLFEGVDDVTRQGRLDVETVNPALQLALFLQDLAKI
jgi:hypothetical protein